MKRLALYAAVAATAMTGMTAMTSQAAVRAYVMGGNCGNGVSAGNGYSLNDILQMVTPTGGSNGCLGDWNGSFGTTLPGTLENSLVPNCSGNENTLLTPNGFIPWNCPTTPDGFGSWNCPTAPDDSGSWNCPTAPDGSGSWNCPTTPDCPGGTDCPDIQNPGVQNPGVQNPDIQNPGTQNPGTQNPGTQNPDIQNPGTQNPGQTVNPESSYMQQVISLVNEERAKMGLSPVTEASDLASAAAVRAKEISSSFSHTRPNGSYYNTALDENGVKYRGSGENIAYGQRTAAEVMDGWMNSQGHRANILNGNYTKIGVGFYEGPGGVKYWVQLFTY